MSQERTVRGWIFVHPTGYIETDYFHTRRFHDQQGRIVRPRTWGDLYRPGCKVVRAALTWKEGRRVP